MSNPRNHAKSLTSTRVIVGSGPHLWVFGASRHVPVVVFMYTIIADC